VALAVPLLACLAWLPSRLAQGTTARRLLPSLPLIALAGLAASGLLSAASPSGDGLLGPFGWPAQACALVALAAALLPAAALPARRRPAGQDTPATAGEEDR
jgi:hypothetical protein